MPNLLFFAPCEKVLVDQNNTTSVIAIMEEVKVQTIAGVAVPPNTVLPMQWAVITLWEQSSEWDNNRKFEQRTTLVSTEGKNVIDMISPFTFDKPRYRVVNQIIGMPMQGPGLHKVKIYIRDVADPPKEWKEIALFPLVISLLPGAPEPTTIN